jgi:hypothetical protein
VFEHNPSYRLGRPLADALSITHARLENTMPLRINGEPVNATEFAYDGCHKIYLIRTPEERATMVSYGYGADADDSAILPISELPDIWDETCGLRFISSADLTEYYVEQCDDATVTYTDN